MSSTPLLATSRVKGDDGFILTNGRSAAYMLVDLIGGIRQILAAVQASCFLAGVKFGASLVAIPVALGLTGVTCFTTACAWTIPDAHEAHEKTLQAWQDAGFSEEADQALINAELGVVNQYLYGTMGVAQTAVSAIHILHYTSVLTGNAAMVASIVANIALGAIYLARGTIMLISAIKTYRVVNEFRNAFKSCFTDDGSIDHAIEFMKTADTDRRVDPSCLIKEDGTAFTSKDGLDYLKAVDKGIFTEELRQKVKMAIATAMIIGGLLAIITASILSGGTALIIIGLVSAIFFISMEYIFLTYDSNKLFTLLRDFLYQLPDYLISEETTA